MRILICRNAAKLPTGCGDQFVKQADWRDAPPDFGALFRCCDCVMVPTPFSTDDETWPLMAALTWIATRSLTFTESYAARDILDAQNLLRVAREGYGTPFNIGYGAAFHSLNKNIDEQEITGLGTKLKWIVPAKNEQLPIDQCFAQAEAPEVFESCIFDPQELVNAIRGDGYRLVLKDFTFHNGDCFTPDGTGYGSPNPDGSRVRWTWKGVTFAREDVLRLWPDWTCFAAWKQAKAHVWKPPQNLSPDGLNNLPAGHSVSIAKVVDLLAFGPDILPIGLSAVEENAARFRAGLALMEAAREAKITLCGHSTFRLPHHPRKFAPVCILAKIESTSFADKTLASMASLTGLDQ